MTHTERDGVKLTKAGALYHLAVLCRRCGRGHFDVPGDDSTWRCQGCDAPLRRAALATHERKEGR